MAQSEEENTPYQDIFEASRDAIMVHDAETGEILQVNPAAGRMLGMDRSDIVGLRVGAFSPPSYTTEEANDLIRSTAQEGAQQVEWSIQGPDGERRWVDVQLERATIGEQTRVVAYIRDVTDHKQIQRRYRTERDMLDQLLNVSPVGIIIHDAEGQIVKTNEQAETILGVDQHELIGSRANPDQFTLSDTDGEVLEDAAIPFNVVADTGEEIRDRELVVERPDGNRVTISVSASPLYDDGDLERIVVSVEDVTERQERQRRRIERNEQLQTLVDNLPVVVFTLDTEGIFTHSSGKGLRALGAEPGDFEGMSVYDAYAEYDDIVDAVDKALDGEEVRVTQEIDDLVFETWYQPVFDEDGTLEQVVGVARDITELKRREERVEALNDATQDLLYARSEAEVADIVTAIAGRIIERPISAMWSYDEPEETLYPIGATDDALSFVGAESVEDLNPLGPETTEKRVFDSGESTVIENYQEIDSPSSPQAPLGTLLSLPLEEYGMLNVGSDEVEPFSDTERFLLEILASTATAALSRVEREAELEAQRAELKRSNEALQQFAYIASHDLQEPLRMVSSYVDLLESEYGDELDEEASEYMDFAVDGARRMKDMIDGLLSYSRVETQGSTFDEVDPAEILATTERELSLFLEDEALTVEYDSLPRVQADGPQLGQLFQNLIKNAAIHGDASTVEVTATESPDEVEFAVADDGVGIPDRQQEQIFGIFEQGDTTSTGSGIGLAVCERIVHRHDGDIWVESAIDEGTTFKFTIPRPRGGDRQ